MKKILLIEDNLDVRENTAEILELANYEVVTAENGKVGVEKAKQEKPDLIICDIMMPELDGYGVLYLVSRDPETSNIPFIFLSAKSEKSDIRKGMNLGADDYLTKPFEEMELLNAIDSRLQRSEVFKKDFGENVEAFSSFIDEAKALEELSKLSADKKVREYKKKEVVFYEDDFASAVFLIKSGKIKTHKTNDDGKEFNTGLYKEGDYFGYEWVLQGSEYGETAVTMENSQILKINKNDFLDLLHKNRDVSAKFVKMLANNIAEKEERLLHLAYDSVRQRVAGALIALQKKYEEENSDVFEIAISRDDLASIVGTSTESVIRTLSDFKDEGLIEVKASKIKLVNTSKLENLRF